jgi:hypothetical protein
MVLSDDEVAGEGRAGRCHVIDHVASPILRRLARSDPDQEEDREDP